MSTLRDVESWIAEQLPTLLEQHGVPGAAVAVLADGEVVDAAAGLLSKSTRVEATPDSVFQIGSITKLWTASLVMQLVDEGLVDLDEPVRRYLPDFRIADESAAATITARQLLRHTAGFEGDIFTDTGDGDDCLEKYVGVAARRPAALPARRAVLLQQRRLLRARPAGRGAARQAVRRLPPRAPVHAARPDPRRQRALRGDPLPGRRRPPPARPGRRPRAGPGLGAGALATRRPASMLAMRPRDLLAFARMHLNDGRGNGRHQVLCPASVEAMQEPQVELPDLGAHGHAWGLGWELFDSPAARWSATTAAPSASPRSSGSCPSTGSRSRC